MNSERYPLLSQIDSPKTLRAMPASDMPQVCTELRDYLIEVMSTTSGHFAAGLGALELTVAMHYVYDTPKDRLVWDVGHQAYPHKVLTGRADELKTIRKWNGLAPFPKRAESEYDTLGVGHSSTSIGAALGMAIANDHQSQDKRIAAIIGDGAMTAGMAFEALNHAGSLDVDLLVVLNDNEMSISENVGAMARYSAKILSGKTYTTIKEGGKKILQGIPTALELARRSEEYVKGMVLPGTIFEELGFNYIGPIDGHDVMLLIETLQNMRELQGPQFLHIVTKKGKGYAPAEADPIKWHAPGPFDRESGSVKKKKSTTPTYSQVFGEWLCDSASHDERVVGITPAMREGSGMVEFSRRFPRRYFDVAIAEQHSVTLAAGLACDGMKPVVAIYSTFLQRAYDQLIHDVAIQNLPVVFAIDRAGLVGADGPTHAGSFDLTYLRCVPNMVVMAPANENECRQMLSTGLALNQPSAVRYPRGQGPGVAINKELQTLEVGKAEMVRKGQGLAILSFGALLENVRPLADKLGATLVNMRFVKPLDSELLQSLSATHSAFVTVEDNAIAGGAGSAVNEYLQANNIAMPVLNLGIPDEFVEHGSREECLSSIGLDAEGLQSAIESWPHCPNLSSNKTSNKINIA
ncbi:MAG: 1-deoxy-D-xylulose-5-phosphate synthase [Gammaproteobacteria bacterium]|nr:1-deoxy-D-xylulose-5-phosphate synthase [Gammaproteobacteria bacterium]NNC97706.1 1-deoxy-D-xylulose-5-phosphate synthase [Gammaproteobacteria bacterium]NNM14042.1 1-deoxy-D-xylulose-5-phosphate synthase [Gammaproteobacteria bacterium]